MDKEKVKDILTMILNGDLRGLDKYFGDHFIQRTGRNETVANEICKAILGEPEATTPELPEELKEYGVAIITFNDVFFNTRAINKIIRYLKSKE